MAVASCGGKDDEAVANLNKLATKLQDCDSARVDYKAKYEEASAQLRRLQEQAAGGDACGVITASAKPSSASTASGPSLSLEQAKKVVFQNTGGLKQCYERALKRDSALQTQPIKVTFRFFIHPAGNAGQTSLSSDTHVDGQLVECWKQAIGRWKFPPFGGEAIEFQFPLAFQPVGK